MMHSGHGPFCNFLEITLPDLSAFDPRAPESYLPQNQAKVIQVMSQAPPQKALLVPYSVGGALPSLGKTPGDESPTAVDPWMLDIF